jgi:exopolysaccharide biosynthesis polyprenyl glycosylphosphotransferase
MNSSKLSQTTDISPDTDRTGVLDMTVGATGPIMKAISRRRSHRHQWRIFECIAMLLLDATLIDASFRLAHFMRYNVLFRNSLLTFFRNNIENNNPTKDIYASLSSFTGLEIGVVVGLVVIFAFRGLYNIRLTGSWFRQVWTIASSATVGLAFLVTYFFVFQPPSSSRLLVPFIWIMAIVVLSSGRLIVSAAMGMLYRLGLGETRLLVVGSGRLGKMIMQHIAANPNLGYSIVGFLHDMNESPSDFGRFKVLGTLEDLGLVIRSMQVDEVIIALPSNMHQQSIKSVRLCERLGASFKLVPDLYELSLSRIDMEAIEGIPLIGIKQVSLNTIQRMITRAVDITVSLFLMIVGSPLWLCIALAVRINSPGEIIYKQKRIGLNGCPFQFYKFRSMYENADQMLATLWAKNEAQGPIFKMKEDPRVTPIGKLLRRTSLDEFPQLINVLKGEMSLVGPRPPLPSEVAQYEEWQKGRLAIKPGLTGLWQVRGRSNLSFDEGVLMDLYYIENWSLRLYFQILFRTIPAVVFRLGAY